MARGLLDEERAGSLFALAAVALLVGRAGLALAHRGALHGDAVSCLAHAVQHGVGEGRVCHRGVPLVDRQLARHDRRAQPRPVRDFQQSTGPSTVQGSSS